jgi:hypothetical protein
MSKRATITRRALSVALWLALAASPVLAQHKSSHGDAHGASNHGTHAEGGGHTNAGGAGASTHDGGSHGAPDGHHRLDGDHKGPHEQAGPSPPPNLNVPPGGIDLTRPDDGYGGTIRRGMFPRSPVGGLTKKTARPTVPTLAPLPHNGPEITRSPIGTALPGSTTGRQVRHQPGFMTNHTANIGTLPRNTAGVGSNNVVGPYHGITGSNAIGAATPTGVHHLATPVVTSPITPLHVTGVNGTTISRVAAGPSSIGGPSKPNTGINGTTIRRH